MLSVLPPWAWFVLSAVYYADSVYRLFSGTYTPMNFAGDVLFASSIWLMCRRWR